MSNLVDLHKLLKKSTGYSADQQEKSLKHALIKSLYNAHQSELTKNKNIEREILFLAMYYGIIEPALTLEAIGKAQPQELTRERVRQIINSVLPTVKKQGAPYLKTKQIIIELLSNNSSSFLVLKDILNIDYLEGFKKNSKGLIAFLNDCGIKQVAYRKDYYLYLPETKRSDVIKAIQKYNKSIRKTKTISNMSLKAKTVTYVPEEVKKFLSNTAKDKNLGLNELYEQIFQEFIEKNPYKDLSYTFGKTQSWKSRKGLAQWEQIGIYIEKNLFDKLKSIVKKLKNKNNNVSFMAFISQSFIWYCNQHKPTN